MVSEICLRDVMKPLFLAGEHLTWSLSSDLWVSTLSFSCLQRSNHNKISYCILCIVSWCRSCFIWTGGTGDVWPSKVLAVTCVFALGEIAWRSC